MIVYIYNIGVDLYNGFNGLRHRINWTYFTVLDGLAHPLYSVNGVLFRLCKKADIPTISIHGLRHTHASLLLYAGVSIASVARRLGHASMTTTQKTYLHIIQELENQDVDIVMRSLANLS